MNQRWGKGGLKVVWQDKRWEKGGMGGSKGCSEGEEVAEEYASLTKPYILYPNLYPHSSLSLPSGWLWGVSWSELEKLELNEPASLGASSWSGTTDSQCCRSIKNRESWTSFSRIFGRIKCC